MRREGDRTIVELRATTVDSAPLKLDVPQFAPATPDAPRPLRAGAGWRVQAPGADSPYVHAVPRGPLCGGFESPLLDTAPSVRSPRTGPAATSPLPPPTLLP